MPRNVQYLLGAVIALALLVPYGLISFARHEEQTRSVQQATADAPIPCGEHLDCGEFGWCDPQDHACRIKTAEMQIVDTETGEVTHRVAMALMVDSNGPAQFNVCLEPPPDYDPCEHVAENTEPYVAAFIIPISIDEAGVLGEPCYDEQYGDGDGQEFQEDVPDSTDSNTDAQDYPAPQKLPTKPGVSL